LIESESATLKGKKLQFHDFSSEFIVEETAVFRSHSGSPSMTDKVLVTNVCVQKNKYGPRGYARLEHAIRGLVRVDLARGLKTLVVDISNRAQMRKYKAVAVSDAGSEAQNKRAIDRIFAAIRPQYLVLIDGPDVIPHIRLNNPLPADKDGTVPSDLPYASDAPFTKSADVATYAAVTRVVGRVPGVTGVNDPRFLISQIRTAAAFRSRRRGHYLSHLAISAHLFRRSTERSVDNIFHRVALKVSPPTDAPKLRRIMPRLSHFINCHGAEGNPNFYGQRGSQIMVSMTSDDVAERTRRGTIVAAECYFGAQLFDPAIAEGKMPMANSYLNAGAIGFFGSTSTSYGSIVGNGTADLITQYFLCNVLEGASIGRACLQARQKFVQSQKMENPVNLKTIAQFMLLGDPSLQPVRGEAEADGSLRDVDYREARRARRVALAAFGNAAADCSGFPGRKIAGGKTKLQRLVRKIAVQRGLRVGLDAIEAFEIVGGEDYANEMKRRDVRQHVVVATYRERVSTKNQVKGSPLTRVLVAHAQNDSLTDVIEYIRK
jgi:hypothetical protein